MRRLILILLLSLVASPLAFAQDEPFVRDFYDEEVVGKNSHYATITQAKRIAKADALHKLIQKCADTGGRYESNFERYEDDNDCAFDGKQGYLCYSYLVGKCSRKVFINHYPRGQEPE